MGDALDASEQSMFNFDTAAVHTAFMQTIVDNQGPNGDVPTVVPNGIPRNASCNDIAWTSVFPQLTNMMHSYHGDTRLIRNHWHALTKYQENLINVANSNQGLAQCDKYQDWLCGTAQSCCSSEPQGSSCDVGPEMGGFNYILGLRAMSQMARAIGNAVAAKRYSALADEARHRFHTDFYNPAMHAYVSALCKRRIYSVAVCAFAVQLTRKWLDAGWRQRSSADPHIPSHRHRSPARQPDARRCQDAGRRLLHAHKLHASCRRCHQ
jgi:glycogen debranching enzyme